MRLPQRRILLLLSRFVGLLSGVCTAQLLLSTASGGGRLPTLCRSASSASSLAVAAVSVTAEPTDARVTHAKQPRIFCLILTQPAQYAGLAVRVNNTWARKCDKYYFIGSRPTNVSIPLLYLPLAESRRILWKKVRMSFEAVHATERLGDFDFFLKADDDTYVVMENLRSLLRDRDPELAAVYGRRFAYNGDKRQQYMSGGAGYVLSRQALRLLVRKGFGQTRPHGMDYCNLDFISVEDYLMGRCLDQIGVKFEDSLDESGRERFHPLRPETMVNPSVGPSWLGVYNYHPFKKCVTCISNTTISYHYVENMLEMEFLFYHIRVAK